jgi:small subunit ribosomal protein S21
MSLLYATSRRRRKPSRAPWTSAARSDIPPRSNPKACKASGHILFVRSPPPLTKGPPSRGFGGPGGKRSIGERTLVQIFVRDNNVDQALKALKKKMQREGSFREMKRHVHYEKPSEKRARQKAEAVRRARKLARKRAQREGLIAAPKKPAPR